MPCNAISWSGRHRGTRRRSPTWRPSTSTAATPSPIASSATRQRAQDATQQALLSAWRDLSTLRDLERFDAWLYRIVVHACYVEGRSHRRWTARIQVLSVVPPDTPDLATSVVDRDALEHAFRLLTPEQRAVVVLHHHLGYPLTEIAATLGIPEGTARSRLHYAVRQLRVALATDAPSVVIPQERPA